MALATPRPFTFTLDVEEHRPSADAPARMLDNTRRVLDWVGERDVRGTVFVVGEVAGDHPELVRDIAAAGHEVGLHAWRHAPLPELSVEVFREESRRGKELLEDLSGAPVTGYRAPTFSLVPESAWAPEVLTELGFTYSSSVLPGRNPPLYAFPGAPREPFTWPSGLVELPAPVVRVGPLSIPWIGGAYLRVLPWWVIRWARRRADDRVLFTYCHPYDFDPDEPYWVVPEAGRGLSRLLWVGRRRMFERVGRLLDGGVAPPLGERLDEAKPAAAHTLVVPRP